MSGNSLVGLFPAGGLAKRIAPLAGSKEVFPIGFNRDSKGLPLSPKAIGQYMLEKMRLAGTRKIYIISRKGKWDIQDYFGDGSSLGMHFAYLVMNSPLGVPFTIDQAYPFLRDATVLFGFPDILFEPQDAFSRLLNCLEDSGADIVLGLFPAHQPHKMDMVEIGRNDVIDKIIIKPKTTSLKYTWIIAVWNWKFTQFIHDYVSSQEEQCKEESENKKEYLVEKHLGDVIQEALSQDIVIDSVKFDEGTYLDIGTPDDLEKAVKLYATN